MTTTRHPRPVRLVACGLLAAAAAVLAGCYTLIQHPRVEALNFRRPPKGPCSACHTRQAIDGFLRPERLAPDPPPWDGLSRPWWLEADSTGGDG